MIQQVSDMIKWQASVSFLSLLIEYCDDKHNYFLIKLKNVGQNNIFVFPITLYIIEH